MAHAITSESPKWRTATSRVEFLYPRHGDIRTPFARDYNRILHSTAYRRLKHKTQVFSAPTNDHICTRIEHVNHVAAISHTISNHLGLNTELTGAIAIGHDVGHAPFGHAGERHLTEIAKAEIGFRFWHERNSLRFVDKCETLEDPNGIHRNLNLTYAVRDGIVCHCGEVDENGLTPRSESIDLDTIEEPNQYQPYTWEGCIVKVSDKIAYLGRDIEDAMRLRILSLGQLRELSQLAREHSEQRVRDITNTFVIHELIIDLCRNSSPESGIRLSDARLRAMDALKEFNVRCIYGHPRLNTYSEYAGLVIRSIFKQLRSYWEPGMILENLERDRSAFPSLTGGFVGWLRKYDGPSRQQGGRPRYANCILYDCREQNDYCMAIIDYISGMTDHFALRAFAELTSF